MKKKNVTSSPTCKAYLEREAVLNAIDTALDDHTWSMGPEDDIEQIIRYVVAVPEVEFDLQEFKKLKEQLEIFKEIGCNTCEHIDVGHDHMPCYKCEDYSEYIWRAAKIEEKYKK